MKKVYVYNCKFVGASKNKIKDLAEKNGLVYTLKGFENAVNQEDLFFDDKFILID